jgi:hypothetical protein
MKDWPQMHRENPTLAPGAIACLALAAFLAVLLAPCVASADEGVTKVSRHVAEPGDRVTVTIGCACLPPCRRGPGGHVHPEGFKHGPCILGSKSKPPASFGVSLLSEKRARAAERCTRRSCPSPVAALPPDPYAAPYAFLGSALPPPGGNDPESGELPRYLLTFTVPDLRPGAYTFVIWCRACGNGRRGRLNVDPREPAWRLTVRAPQ